MGDLSPHFSRREFACRSGVQTIIPVDAELLNVLEELRSHVCFPITITSGNRTMQHNAAVGGANNSLHLVGMAADIQVKNYKPKQIADLLHGWYPYSYGIGLYEKHVHFDVRPGPAWRNQMFIDEVLGHD